MLIDLGRIIPAQYLVAKDIAKELVNRTYSRLGSITATLANDITKVASSEESVGHYTFEWRLEAGLGLPNSAA
jgi:hypothetical protein